MTKVRNLHHYRRLSFHPERVDLSSLNFAQNCSKFPQNNIAHFTDELSKTLDSYLNQFHDLALMGDFNINLDPEKRQTELLGFGLFPVITKPTRVTVTSQTLIDHIFTNITARTVTSGIYQYDITDHFPIFCQIHNNAPKHKLFNKLGFYRDYAAVSQTLFEEDINAIFENESVLAPLYNENNVNSVLEQFIFSIQI